MTTAAMVMTGIVCTIPGFTLLGALYGLLRR